MLVFRDTLTLSLIFLLAGTIEQLPLSAQGASEIEEQTNIRVYRQAQNSVVSIRSSTSTGSGTIIDNQGLILTNNHVVGRTPEVTVTLADGRQLSGRVISATSDPDLALIRLDRPPTNLIPIPFAPPSRPIEVGQRTFAIGNPFGRFAGTLTTGIISRIDRTQNLIQTNALLQPGNSGGPLLNRQGELIGINTAIFRSADTTNTGLGFAITIDRVRQFVADTQAGKIGTLPPLPTLPLNNPPITKAFTDKDERLPDGSYFQVYTFAGQAGQRITIEMQSRQIDSYLVLFDANGKQIAEDDDSGGGKNARIQVTLSTTGTYTLYANSYEGGKIGNYTLSARSTSSSPSVLLDRKGRLTAQSPTLQQDGTPYEMLSFTGKAGQTVQITMTSRDFHPYLLLYSPDQKLLKEHDGLPDRQRAMMQVRLPHSGTYRVVANTFDRRGKGEYQIIIKEITSADR